MERFKKALWLFAALCCIGAFAFIAFARPGYADTPRPASWPSEVTLPAGRKLVTVTWLCYQACEPWAVTRPMRTGEVPETYAFTNGRETIVYREAAPSR